MSEEHNSRLERRHNQKKNRSQRRKGSWWTKALLGLGAVFILVMIASAVAVAVVIHDAPTLKASDLQTPQSTRIYDDDEKLVSTLFHEENRVKVDIDDVPDEVKDAVISIEDKRFRDHHGLDYRRLLGAVKANIKGGWGSEGGSTLTQQVIKQSVLSPEKTLKRKIQEAWLALKLERNYSKDEILEMYLNNVYFGHRAYGIETASKTFFDEGDLSKLNVSQRALLAGLPNAPSAADPFKHPDRAKKRRDQVLNAMVKNNAITQKEADEAKDKSISDILKDEETKQENSDPYNAFVDTVYEQMVEQEEVVSDKDFFQGGLKIYTTLDSDAQQSVYDILQSDDIPYPDDDFETGISLVDTETGAVKAVGGGRNFKSLRDYNYGSKVQNDPGSTIKPILDYGPAIEHLNWPTSHTLTDEEYEYSNGKPIREWDGEYWGDISMRRSLEWSRNIPALKAFQEVGEDKAQEFAKGLGINIDPINESAAIGNFEGGASPLQMAEAFAAFGNGGTYNEPFTVKKIKSPDGDDWEPDLKSDKAMEDYSAYMITDMLKTVVSSGTGTDANIEGLPVAGKTGSTNISDEDIQEYGILEDGLHDSWFTGYTPQYSLSVWTGYPSFIGEDGDPQYIREDGTQDISKQIFRQLMSEVSDPDMEDFKKPDSVVSIGSELYVQGTQPDTQKEENPYEDEEEEQDEEQSDEEEDEQDEEDQEDDEEDREDEEEDQEDDEEDQEEDDDEQDEEQPDEDEQEDEQDEEQPEEDDEDNEEDENENAEDEDENDESDDDEDNSDAEDDSEDTNSDSEDEDDG